MRASILEFVVQSRATMTLPNMLLRGEEIGGGVLCYAILLKKNEILESEMKLATETMCIEIC
jgi:hypothetical protein